MGKLNIRRLKKELAPFRRELQVIKNKSAPAPGHTWFGYDILGNVEVFNGLLEGRYRDLDCMIESRPVADIGGADGDVAFFLERQGVQAELVDCSGPNWNGLLGAKKLKEVLGSSIEIYDVDLDSQFSLPREDYGLILFLGLLYHLKNPYYVLEQLANRARYCLFSTKVARLIPDHSLSYHALPMAYLLDARECNDDETNYWVFSESCLRRLLTRTGWEVLAWRNLGDTVSSDPADVAHDERAYALLRSVRV